MTDKQTMTALLALSEPWYISRIDVDVPGEEVHVHIHHRHGTLPCSSCGRACPVRDHAEERTWRHLDLWQCKTFLHAAMPRTDCPQHGVLRVALPWCEPGSRFSRAFEAHVILAISACLNVESARELLRISWDEARGIMERAVDRGLARRRLVDLPRLSVDEKSIRKCQRFVTVLMDVDRRRIIEVTPGRSAESMVSALACLDERQKQGVAVMSMDMSPAYQRGVELAFPAPRPDIVHDRFHIVGHMNDALNEVRAEEARELASQGRDDLKGTRQMWLFGEENLPERHAPTFAQLKDSDLRTATVWAMKENLRWLWNQRSEKAARGHFRSWLRWVETVAIKPVTKVAEMITRHLVGVMAFFRHRITNGPQEGINSRLMTILRAARGYRSPETFRMAALFFLGGLDLMPRAESQR